MCCVVDFGSNGCSVGSWGVVSREMEFCRVVVLVVLSLLGSGHIDNCWYVYSTQALL